MGQVLLFLVDFCWDFHTDSMGHGPPWENYPKVSIIVGDDFKAKDIIWDSYSMEPGRSHASLCKGFIKTLHEYHLEQLQKSSTRQDSILNLYSINQPRLAQYINLIPGFTAEGHEFIIIDSWIPAAWLKKAPRKFFKWSKAYWTEIKARTAAFIIELLSQNQRSVQENYTTFCDHTQNILNSCLPHGYRGTHTCAPSLVRELKYMCGKRHCMYNKAKKSNWTKHWDVYKEYTRDAVGSRRRW